MGFGWFGFCYLFPILTFPLFLFFFMWINWVLKNILFYRHYYLINYTTLSVAVSLAFIVYIFNVACHQITWYHWLYLSSWTPKSLQMVAEVMKLKCLLFGKKAMTNLNSIFKSRDITLSTKVCIVKVVVFPVVMHRCEMDILSCSSANKKKQTNKKPRGGKDIKILSIIYPEEIQVGSLMEATNLKSFPLCK